MSPSNIPPQIPQDIISTDVTSASLGWVVVPLTGKQLEETLGCEGSEELTKTPNTRVRYDQFVTRLFKADTREQMFNHAALGVCGEAGELADAIKKHIHYNHPLDKELKGKNQTLRENIIEELGDLRFYIQTVMNLVGISETQILQYNAAKLGKRYADLTYSDSAAIMRADKNS